MQTPIFTIHTTRNQTTWKNNPITQQPTHTNTKGSEPIQDLQRLPIRSFRITCKSHKATHSPLTKTQHNKWSLKGCLIEVMFCTCMLCAHKDNKRHPTTTARKSKPQSREFLGTEGHQGPIIRESKVTARGPKATD